MFELINPYVGKIAVAARDGDSIRNISKKIRESYGWTYRWALELEKIGAIKRKGQEIRINKKNRFFRGLSRFVASSAANLNLNDAYLLPNLTGLEYIFTSTDSVFIWTKGGYNIGRSRDSYPIFIEVLEKDKAAWQKFFLKLGIKHAFKNIRRKGIYFVVTLSKEIQKEYCDNIPFLPLKKTVEWARKYSFNFQPALEMLGKLYNLNIGVKYAEA